VMDKKDVDKAIDILEATQKAKQQPDCLRSWAIRLKGLASAKFTALLCLPILRTRL